MERSAGDAEGLAALHALTESARGGDGDPPPRRRSLRPAVMTAAAAATTLVVGLAAGAALGGAAVPSATAPAQVVATEPVTTPAPDPPTVAGEAAAGAIAPALPVDQIQAAALTAVRLGATDTQYIDTAAVEAVQAVGDVAVVTVRAVVLDRDGERWGGARLGRYAIAVAAREGQIRAMTAAWPLAPPAASAADVTGDPVGDAALVAAAERALAAAGYRDVGRLRLAAVAGGPLLARVQAAAPGEDAPRSHTVGLTADATAVLGLPPPGGRDDEEAP